MMMMMILLCTSLRTVDIDGECFFWFAARCKSPAIRSQLYEPSHLRLHVRQVSRQSPQRLSILLLLLLLLTHPFPS